MIDEQNIGYYNYKDEIVYWGEFADGFYKSGILMRKEGEDYNIYYGHFELDGNVQKFEGLFLPGKLGIIIYGTIIKNEITGIVLYHKDDRIEKIYKGKLVNNKKEGDNVIINFEDLTLVSEGSEMYTYFTKKQLTHNGVDVFRLLKKSIYLKKDQKDIIYYENNNIYEGSVDENYNRKGLGKYHIFNDNIAITGNFDVDNVEDAKVTNKDNFVVFEGKFADNKMSEGIFHFSEKERFNGTYENGKKKRGKYFYPNGTTYEGEWYDDRKIGTGKHTNEKGETKEINY